MEHKSSLGRSGLYAGAVLLFFCLLAHFTATQPAGGVAGAVGTLILSLARIAVLLIGLTIGIAICIAVMLGLYVACAHLLGGEELARTTAAKVKKAVADTMRQCLPCVKRNPAPEAECRTEALQIQLNDFVDKRSFSAALSANADQTAAVMREVEKVRETVRAAAERSNEALVGELSPLQESLETLAKRCEAQEAAGKEAASVKAALDGLAARFDALERQTAALAALPQQLNDLQSEVRLLQEELQQTQESLKAKSAADKSAQLQSKGQRGKR